MESSIQNSAEINVVAKHVADITQYSKLYQLVKHHPSQHNKDQPVPQRPVIQVLIHHSPQPPTLGTDLD